MAVSYYVTSSVLYFTMEVYVMNVLCFIIVKILRLSFVLYRNILSLKLICMAKKINLYLERIATLLQKPAG